MPGLFVSYRRDDSQGFAGRLADDLGAAFGPDHVFSDVEIPVGSDFSAVLHRAIAGCDALLVVIGRHWVGRSMLGNRSRLFEPDDWVRIEIESALAQGVWVVPVLVGGATMPSSEMLPESLRALTRVQAATLSDRRWDADVADVVAMLHGRFPLLPDPSPRSPERPLPTGRHAPSPQAPASASSRAMRLALNGMARSVSRGLRRIVTAAIVLALIYTGLRLMGDAETLRMLDALEARLQIGWARLLGYASTW